MLQSGKREFLGTVLGQTFKVGLSLSNFHLHGAPDAGLAGQMTLGTGGHVLKQTLLVEAALTLHQLPIVPRLLETELVHLLLVMEVPYSHRECFMYWV